MTIQELEKQLLSLDQSERLRLSQLLTQSLTSESPTQDIAPKTTLADAIAQFRHNMSLEELDPNAVDIWQDVRDRSPAPSEPRW
jgi:uncharacterized protein (DUF1919 family)